MAADGLEPHKRLGIYDNTATSTLVKALPLSFPAIQSLVGTEFFEHAIVEQFVSRLEAERQPFDPIRHKVTLRLPGNHWKRRAKKIVAELRARWVRYVAQAT